MSSDLLKESEQVDKESTKAIEEDPSIADRIDTAVPYFCLDLLLKTSELSISQMVVAVGPPYGKISIFETLIAKFLQRGLIKEIHYEGEPTPYYRISGKEEAKTYFMELASQLKG